MVSPHKGLCFSKFFLDFLVGKGDYRDRRDEYE